MGLPNSIAALRPRLVLAELELRVRKQVLVPLPCAALWSRSHLRNKTKKSRFPLGTQESSGASCWSQGSGVGGGRLLCPSSPPPPQAGRTKPIPAVQLNGKHLTSVVGASQLHKAFRRPKRLLPGSFIPGDQPLSRDLGQ